MAKRSKEETKDYPPGGEGGSSQVWRLRHLYAQASLFGINGSGMHVHQSLFKGERNAFFDRDDEYHLSRVAKCFIAGLLKHAPERTQVTDYELKRHLPVL